MAVSAWGLELELLEDYLTPLMEFLKHSLSALVGILSFDVPNRLQFLL